MLARWQHETDKSHLGIIFIKLLTSNKWKGFCPKTLEKVRAKKVDVVAILLKPDHTGSPGMLLSLDSQLAHVCILEWI